MAVTCEIFVVTYEIFLKNIKLPRKKPEQFLIWLYGLVFERAAVIRSSHPDLHIHRQDREASQSLQW